MGTKPLKKIPEIINSDDFIQEEGSIPEARIEKQDPGTDTTVTGTAENYTDLGTVPDVQPQDIISSLYNLNNPVLNDAITKAYLQYCREFAARPDTEKGK